MQDPGGKKCQSRKAMLLTVDVGNTNITMWVFDREFLWIQHTSIFPLIFIGCSYCHIVPPHCRIDTVYHNFCAYADKLKSVYGVSKSHFHAGSTEIRIPSHSTDASSLFVMIRHLVSGIKL